MADTTGPPLLYVEDEPLIQELGVTALREAGFEIEALQSGAAAIAALDDHGSAFKALITDIDLGGMPNGWLVAKHARERFSDLPIIYVSGDSSNDWASMGVPGSVMVVKPYAPAQLVVAVSTAILGTDNQLGGSN